MSSVIRYVESSLTLIMVRKMYCSHICAGLLLLLKWSGAPDSLTVVSVQCVYMIVYI